MSDAAERTRERAVAWLEGLGPAALERLARRFAGALEQDGLLFFDDVAGRARAIPATLTPEPLAPETLRALGAGGSRLLAAAVKAARFSLSPAGACVARRLHAELTPLEREALHDPSRLGRLATARVDVFLTDGGAPRVLEINATIPAMQGYADMVAERWIRTLAAERGLGACATDALVAHGGSNTLDLLDCLLAGYRGAEGRRAHPSILIVSRRDDAQQTELGHYARTFRAAGYPTEAVCADEIDVDANGHVIARGTRFDLVYRHIFAHRVDPASTFGRLLVEPGPNVILNPVASPLENKGLLALLHESVDDPAAARAWGLEEDEREAIAALVPWTRRFVPGPAVLVDGSSTPDLAAWVARHADGLVLKRSQDYGGRTVFVGRERETATFGERVQALYGEACDSWAGLVARAARDAHAWVVQEYVPPPRRRHLLLERDSTGGVRAVWRDLRLDLGVFLSLGVDARPRGAATRVSTRPVVNLHSGGGMAPTIPVPVLDSLLARTSAAGGRPDARDR